MAKVERRIDIDSDTWNRILRHLPNTSLHVVVNELLYQFANTLHDSGYTLDPLYEESARRTKESLGEE